VAKWRVDLVCDSIFCEAVADLLCCSHLSECPLHAHCQTPWDHNRHLCMQRNLGSDHAPTHKATQKKLQHAQIFNLSLTYGWLKCKILHVLQPNLVVGTFANTEHKLGPHFTILATQSEMTSSCWRHRNRETSFHLPEHSSHKNVIWEVLCRQFEAFCHSDDHHLKTTSTWKCTRRFSRVRQCTRVTFRELPDIWSKRLGSGVGGANAIKKHTWFQVCCLTFGKAARSKMEKTVLNGCNLRFRVHDSSHCQSFHWFSCVVFTFLSRVFFSHVLTCCVHMFFCDVLSQLETFTTGSYTICWVSCSRCDTQMGWKYIKSSDDNNRAKVCDTSIHKTHPKTHAWHTGRKILPRKIRIIISHRTKKLKKRANPFTRREKEIK